jgi:hypothetical protein
MAVWSFEKRLYDRALTAIDSVTMSGTVTLQHDGVAIKLSGRRKMASRNRLAEVYNEPSAPADAITLLSDGYGISIGPGVPHRRNLGKEFAEDRRWMRIFLPVWMIDELKDLILGDFCFPKDEFYKFVSGYNNVVICHVEDIRAAGFFMLRDPDGCGRMVPVPEIHMPKCGDPILRQGHLFVYEYTPERDEYGEATVPVAISDFSLAGGNGARLLNHTIVQAGEPEPESINARDIMPVGGVILRDYNEWYWTLEVREGRAVEIVSPDHPDQRLVLHEGFYVLTHRAPGKEKVD